MPEQKTGNLSSIGDGGDIVINRHTWGSGTAASSRLSGYIDEVRFSKIARYSGNFTPETKQLQNDENTLLLLNFENTTSNQVIDSSSNQNHGIINGTVNYVQRNEIEDSNAANWVICESNFWIFKYLHKFLKKQIFPSIKNYSCE